MGAIAAASGTVTNAITAITQFHRSLSKSIHKKPVVKGGEKDENGHELPPYLEYSQSLDIVPTSNPVQKAANFSPQHLQSVAYQLASKSLPSNDKKMHSWPATVVAKGIEKNDKKRRQKALYGDNVEHGRAHDAAHDTENFVEDMLAIGLKG